MADLADADVKLLVLVGDEDSAQYAYGMISPAADPVVVISQRAFNDYMVAGVPTNLLVGPDGKAVLGQVGWSEELFAPWMDAIRSAQKTK